jgi:hypothetical protein
MEDWTTLVLLQVDEKLKDVRESDLRFFRVDEFKRNIKRTDEFSGNCPICNREKISISSVVKKIDEAINFPGKSRREYDRLINRMAVHMQKKHGLFTPYYYTYRYTFYGLVAGVLAGYLIMMVAPGQNWAFLSGGVTIGLLAGYIRGGTKDRKIREKRALM